MKKLPPSLFRYSRQEHLDDLIDLGRLRFTKAAKYLDPKLLKGQRDNEMLRRSSLDPKEIHVFDLMRGESLPVFSVDQFVEISVPHYILCFSLLHNEQLSKEFGDAPCVEIFEVAGFIQRLINALKEVFPEEECRPIFHLGGGPVQYYDGKKPLFPRSQREAIYLKDQGYAHQNEFRLLLALNDDQDTGDYVDCELGPLHEIARFC